MGTRLVAVAHGTRDPAGNLIAAELTRLAGERCGVPADVSYVELCEPLLTSVLRAPVEATSTVLVPLLLTTGHHVRVDLPTAVSEASGPTTLTAPLGPDPLLATAQVSRLVAAGAAPGQPVTMVAAGSRDPASLPDLRRAGDLLSGAWGGPVRLATLGGLGPRPVDVVRPGDAVSPYLLAPGFFASRCRDEASSAGATVVAEVIGVHEKVVDLIAARFASARSGPARG